MTAETPEWKIDEKIRLKIFCVADNKRIDRSIIFDSAKVDCNCINERNIFISNGSNPNNLGIHLFDGDLWSSNFVGFCYLKDNSMNAIVDSEGYSYALWVKPRFDINLQEIFKNIRDDDEFLEYLVPQKRRADDELDEIKSYSDNELFTFFYKERAVSCDIISTDIACADIFSAFSYISMLGELCKKPLMSKTVRFEKNLTGKQRGKILINDNIRKNTVGGRNDRFFCSYLVQSVNILENQILKAAFKKAYRYICLLFNERESMSGDSFRRYIYMCEDAFREVDDVDIKMFNFSSINISGSYVYYKKVLNMAKVIIQQIHLDINGIPGTTGYIVPYAMSMQRLYEVYVRAYLKRNDFALSYKKYDVLDAKAQEDKLYLHDYNQTYDILSKEYVGNRSYAVLDVNEYSSEEFYRACNGQNCAKNR